MTAQHQLTADKTTKVPSKAIYGIAELRVNKMGEIAFDGRFGGMQAAQGFVIGALKAGSHDFVQIRCDKRIGWITKDGLVYLTDALNQGALIRDMNLATLVDRLSGEVLFQLKTLIFVRGARAVSLCTGAANSPFVVQA